MKFCSIIHGLMCYTVTTNKGFLSTSYNRLNLSGIKNLFLDTDSFSYYK